MARFATISKYCVLCRPTVLESAKVYTMLTPSIGVCATPFTVFGSGMPAASSTVGATSTTCENWLLISPLALIRAGQVMTSGFRVPPKFRLVSELRLALAGH